MQGSFGRLYLEHMALLTGCREFRACLMRYGECRALLIGYVEECRALLIGYIGNVGLFQ